MTLINEFSRPLATCHIYSNVPTHISYIHGQLAGVKTVQRLATGHTTQRGSECGVCASPPFSPLPPLCLSPIYWPRWVWVGGPNRFILNCSFQLNLKQDQGKKAISPPGQCEADLRDWCAKPMLSLRTAFRVSGLAVLSP